jgi:4-hydroxybenzoate polyprenyltransferase
MVGPISFYSGAMILLIGMLYSFRANSIRINIRLKSYFIMKNFFIGLGWGLLVFLGSNDVSHVAILITFGFFSLQVAIGSVIRDLDDIDEDTKDNVPTLPIVMGLNNTTIALHAVNILSAGLLLLGLEIDPEQTILWVLWVIIIVYRFGLIEAIRKQSDRPFLLQQVNIFACSLVFVGRLAHIWIS